MKSLLMLISGIAIGAGVSWAYHKNKYEQMIQEEVESLRNHMKEKEHHDKSIENPDKKVETECFDNEEKEFDNQMNKAKTIINYNKYSNIDDEEKMVNKYEKPFVVTPEDFASVPGYDTDTFYYHHDDIISNGDQEMVDDIEDILGLTVDEIRDQFGVYEDSAVYIRNPRLKTDYEILLENDDFVRRNGDQ